MVPPVAGLTVANCLPDLLLCHSLLMNSYANDGPSINIEWPDRIKYECWTLTPVYRTSGWVCGSGMAANVRTAALLRPLPLRRATADPMRRSILAGRRGDGVFKGTTRPNRSRTVTRVTVSERRCAEEENCVPNWNTVFFFLELPIVFTRYV